MAIFRYQAITAEGRKSHGVIDADSLEVAKERLHKQRVIFTAIAPAQEQNGNLFTLSYASVLSFTRDMAGLLKAGLPLYEALLTIEEKYRKSKEHALFLNLADQVKQGKQLSQALGCYPKSFDQMYISMIAAGEKTGALERVFLQLFKVLSRSDKFRKTTRAAMIYPAFLGAFCLCLLVALFVFLIPSMKELFEGRTLHPLTATILNLSEALRAYGLYILIALTLIIVPLVLFCRRERGQIMLQSLFLKVPLLKTMITEAVLMRFARALAVLLLSGVPILLALRLSKGVMHHPLFERAIDEVEQGVVQGRKISDELRRCPLIPSLFVRMLKTGEETGNLSEMFFNIAEIYEEDLEKNLAQFTSLLQPLLLLFLGAIVALVLLAVLLPLTDVSTFN